jgi:MerR family transcriptional regulator, light-induced transcriptional regulator
VHDIPLMVFRIALNHVGCRAAYQRSNTPLPDLLEAVRITRPELVVLAAAAPSHLEDVAGELAERGARQPVAVAGAGATAILAARTGARLLSGDPVSEAETVARQR